MVQPFPWHTLEQVSPLHVRWRPTLRRLLQQPEALSGWQRWCQRQLGGRCDPPQVLSVGSVERQALCGLRRRWSAQLGLLGPEQQSILLGVDQPLTATLIGALLRADPVAICGPASAAETGLLVVALASLLLELAPAGSWSVTPQAPEMDGAGPWGSVQLGLTLGPRQGCLWLLFDSQLWQRLQLVSTVQPSVATDVDEHETALARLRGLQWQAPAVLARLSMAADEVAALVPGDVVLSPQLPAGPQQPLRASLRLGGTRVALDVDGAQAQVTSGCQLAEVIMDSEGRPNDPTRVAELTPHLPVEVTVELARVTISAAQLLELQPGDVLALERPTAAHVELRVGERLLARGQLVDLEGEGGVRLEQVFEP